MTTVKPFISQIGYITSYIYYIIISVLNQYLLFRDDKKRQLHECGETKTTILTRLIAM